jgi:serine/threonine-protein kinase HipA
MATQAGVPTNYYADLLARYGRDIAGAFVISEREPDERRWAVVPYTDDELAMEVHSVADAPGFGIRDDSELSIAGLQNKLLVVAMADGRWGRPVHGRPSTHIVKVADDRYPGLLAAEHTCMQLAGAVGLTTVTTELVEIGGIEALVVERYDRARDPSTGTVRRIHQEDACQALGVDIDAHRGRGKYEQFGGPSFKQIATLLDRYADRADQERLLRVLTFTAAIGNADGHGKNVSLLIDTESGAVRLAPLYDTVPTALWPNLRSTSAMSIGGRFDAVPTLAHIIAEASSWGLRRELSTRIASSTIADLREAISGCSIDTVAQLIRDRLDAIEVS